MEYHRQKALEVYSLHPELRGIAGRLPKLGGFDSYEASGKELVDLLEPLVRDRKATE